MGPDATTRGEDSVTSYDVRPIGAGAVRRSRGRRTTSAGAAYERSLGAAYERSRGRRTTRCGAACDALWGNGVGVVRRNVGSTWMG